jgi:Tol biopolymer transport system component
MGSAQGKNHRELGAEAIKFELAAILSSVTFSKSDRHCRFLRYAVEKSLSGRAGDLKEYLIALEVYDRPSTYDPQVESLVRVEASKLRSRLQKYYEDEGREDPIHIEIPKGGYVPVFSDRTAGLAATSRARIITRRRVVCACAAVVIAVLVIVLAHAVRTREPRFDEIQILRLTDSGRVYQAAISPDGQYAAYVTGRAEGREGLWVKHIATGSEVQVVPEGELFFMGPTFSPDSNYVYYGGHALRQGVSSLFRVPVLGGAATRLKNGLDSPISFSPDGAWFAFVREYGPTGESALLIARSGVPEADSTASERKLLSRRLPEFLDYPSWSPDGKYIACTSVNRSASLTNLIRVRVSDGAESAIGSRKWGIVKGLAWLGGGADTLAFAARAVTADVTQIWQYPNPGAGVGEPRAVTSDLSNYSWMSGSKDARNLLSVSDRTLASIWVSESANPTKARLIAINDIDENCRLCWTRDGQLLHHRQLGTRDQLWLMQPDGSNARHLSFDGEARAASVCGQRGDVVFLVPRVGESQIWKMDAAGTHPQMLVGANDYTYPQCSPDGEWVVFTRTGADRWPSLWKVSTNGGLPHKLNTGWSTNPAISPDGNSIAVFYEASPGTLQVPPRNIAIIPIQGGKPIRTFPISQAVAQSAGLRWTTDSKALSYVETRAGAGNILIQPINGSPAVLATNFTGDQISSFDWSSDGQQLAFVRLTVKRDLMLIRDARFLEK